MSERFEQMAASRPKPTLGFVSGYIGSLFMLMRHDDLYSHTTRRDEIAWHLERRAKRAVAETLINGR